MSIALPMDNTSGRQTLIKENEVLIKDSDTWLHFANPHHVIAARRLEELVPALREIEQLIRINNWYAAGFVSYEAASALILLFKLTIPFYYSQCFNSQSLKNCITVIE